MGWRLPVVSLPLLLLVPPTAAACSSSSALVATPVLDAGTGSDGGADANGSVPFVASAPWKASSARIEVSSFGFFEGSMTYAKDRAALGATQLQALEGLRTRPNGSGPTAEDVVTFTIRIVDADGTSATYLATADNMTVSASYSAAATIEKATLDPFLATFACMKAKATETCLASPGGALPNGCKYTKVSTDPGCLNGVFVNQECADIWMSLPIATAGAYEIALTDCIESVAVKVLAADATTVLASGPSGTKPTCSAVTHTFDAPGTYWVVIEKRNAAGCTATGSGGDFYVRVTPRP